jgi:hypothetical protein
MRSVEILDGWYFVHYYSLLEIAYFVYIWGVIFLFVKKLTFKKLCIKLANF